MHELTAGFRVAGAAQRLAVDGHLQTGERPAPAGEDVEHGLGLEHHEDIAEHVMGGHAVFEGEKGAQPGELRLGEVLHVV